MTETGLPQGTLDPDIRLWDPETRRTASLIVLGAAGVFLVAALLYFGLDATGSGWFLWVAIVVLALLLIVEAAIVATGVAREEGGPEWLAGPGAAAATTGAHAEPGPGPSAEPEPPSEEHVHIDLQCPECGDLFSVHDTGERPLHTQCPHCGAEGHVDLEQPPPESVHDEPAAGAAEQAEAAEAVPPGLGDEAEADPEQDQAQAPAGDEVHETISIKCPACDTQFDVEDTGERPLEAICPGCGRGGKLK